MLHTIHNYLFVQHLFHKTNPLIHTNSQLQYANTNLTSPYYMNYSYTNLQCVEGDSTKCMYGNTFNLLYRDRIADKLDNREPSAEETQILNHLHALQLHCVAPPRVATDLFPRALAACLTQDKEFLEIFRDPYNRAPDFDLKFRT